MRRAKVKATICLGRRKPDPSRKAKENSEENCGASCPPDNDNPNSGQQLQDMKPKEETLSPTKPELPHHINTSESVNRTGDVPYPEESLTLELANNITINLEIAPPSPVLYSASNTTPEACVKSSTKACPADSIITVHQTEISLPPTTSNSHSDFIIPEIKKDRPTLTSNLSILNRSKIRAVPKMRVRKTVSNAESVENARRTEDSIPLLTEENDSRSFIQEQISNSQVKQSMPENTTSLTKPITPLSPNKICRSKIRAIPILGNRRYYSASDSDDANKSSSSRTRTESENDTSSFIQEQTSNSEVKQSIPENTTSQTKPITPLSPNKICRSKIRAVPILGNRRYHSASDSDDANKSSSSRTRTESQSSTISGVLDTSDENSTARRIVLKPEFKKKFRRSEGSKKLADAKREFSKKFTGAKPDHKRLTMMDLIYYNPTTNPMKYENKTSEASKQVDDKNEQSEDVDNPAECLDDDAPQQDPGDKSEEEDEIIAPRIKIGPTGELILDEKSLVIENKKTKKAQEAIKNSYVFDGDADRPYGVFKRFKQTKWSQSDTLKFYRALSTVGTDFALMTELFPKRSRRELKLKFKKEERVNRPLIDQAIMKPCNFNFEELKSEFKMMEIEETEIEKQQADKKEMSKKKQDKKSQKFSKLTQDDSPNTKEDESANEIIEKKRGRKPKLHELLKPPKTPKKLDIFSAISDSDLSDPESLDDSEESFMLNSIQTTRYGRKTKRREIFEPIIDIDQEVVIQKRIRKRSPEPEPKQKPGSLMLVSSETSDGQPVVSIFMVTDDKREGGEGLQQANTNNLLPIAMIRTGHKNVEEIVENNYTIPADLPNDHIEENKTINETK